MKLTSKYFDSIRVKPEDEAVEPVDEGPSCNWRGCRRPGEFPAPKGREKEGEYFLFCQTHVREYNKKYNYFVGMKEDDIVDYQKSASTGHRPTWSFKEKMANASAKKAKPDATMDDPYNLFDDETEAPQRTASGRRLRNLERKSLTQLGLTADATKDDIKARYKELVKRHHPDLNGGDRTSEDKLRDVITAYNYLRKVGMV
ncbi:MAG: molecular chaperone DnaJ [Rhodomicrobium sp.]|nr:MAG: molecular chaperone DnaJ [Rhodomicrobium sp.]